MEEQGTIVSNGTGEINFVQLCYALWQQKNLVILATISAFIFACTYLYFTPKLYEAKTYILPASGEDLAVFNYEMKDKNSFLKTFKKRDLQEFLATAFYSEGIKQQFFVNNYLPALAPKYRKKYSKQVIYKQFENNITVKELLQFLPKKYLITVVAPTPGQAKKWAAEYIELVRKSSLQDLASIIHKRNLQISHYWEHKIGIAREIAKDRRLDKIHRLEEDLLLANNKKDFSSNSYAYNSQAPSILKAKIDFLKNRISDDVFIPKLREMQSNLEFYKSAKINRSDITLLKMDGHISLSDVPVHPKSKAVLLLAIMTGLFFGLGIAFIRSLISPKFNLLAYKS